jgi:hypothetical protein
MEPHIIQINWEGPFSCDCVVNNMNRAGNDCDDYAGPDYGLYQIYGQHILCGEDTLLYVGQAQDQTFADRIRQHEKEWLRAEQSIKIYLGRLDELIGKYTQENDWFRWREDIDITESVLIYRYTPHYNSSGLWEEPNLRSFEKVILIHSGSRNKIKDRDIAPDDYKLQTV